MNKQKEDIQTIILCGGLGTRLREETEFRPKPMVNIGDRPILWHIMKIYSSFGFKRFVLPLGYKGEMIKDYFCHYELMNNDMTITLGHAESCEIHGSHDESDWEVTLAHTGLKTLKGGRIKRVEKYIEGDTFMLTYGDGVSDLDINQLLDFHFSHGKMVTVTGVNPTARFGELKTNENSVVAFKEKTKSSDSGYINGGFFVMNKKIFEYLSADENSDLEYGPLEEIAISGELMVYKYKGYWACMDTLRDAEYLNSIWEQGKARWKRW